MMKSLLEVFNEWEIQQLVLLSFMLQMFLFGTGGNLRQRSSNALLRGTIWIAYLGADMVAVYALGFLSKNEEHTTQESGTLTENHPLAFFWAPFLLIHLGGQDTITAFAIEDNNLWLRHLLNLIIQVVLALYVFWKSPGWRNVQLLVPGVFLFVAGIIKYAERTLALKYGIISGFKGEGGKKPNLNQDASYSSIVRFALDSSPSIRHLFAGHKPYQIQGFEAIFLAGHVLNEAQLAKLVNVELGIMYHDLYTKAAVLRTRSVTVLRCISQVSATVALVLFCTSDKRRHNRVDILITYILFTGVLLLEVCSVLMMVMVSPWTWAWLKDQQKCRWLANISWTLVSSNIIGWPEERPLWSNSMGQYSFLSYMGCEEKPSSLPGCLMRLVRKVARAFGAGGEDKVLWISKLLDTKCEAVDKEITECIAKWITSYGGMDRSSSASQQHWPHLGQFLKNRMMEGVADFSGFVVWLHIFTEVYMSHVGTMDKDMVALAGVCRKLSNYMFYLVVAHPASMVQATAGNPELALEAMRKVVKERSNCSDKAAILRSFKEAFLSGEAIQDMLTSTCREALEEIRDMWVRLIVYTAGKSRPEMHAAQLARGGELLTFVWLQMAHKMLGDAGEHIIELINTRTAPSLEILYAFDFPRHD
ncbi:hypothetical protein ACQJBY_047547 [Aegilops geniculata]